MAVQYEEVAAHALELSLRDRVKLAQCLTASLDDESGEDSNVEELWFELAAQRLEEMRSGKVQGIELEDAFAMAHKNLKA